MEQNSKILADINHIHIIETTYLDGENGIYLYRKIDYIEGGDNYEKVAPDSEIDINILNGLVGLQKDKIKWLENAPRNIRRIGYLATIMTSFMISRLEISSNTPDQVLATGICAVFGVVSTEITRKYKKNILEPEKEDEQEKLDVLMNHIRRLA